MKGLNQFHATMNQWCSQKTMVDDEQILRKVERELNEESRIVVEAMLRPEDEFTVDQLDEDLDLDAKHIRKVLYKLNEKGWARSRRHRNEETGWYEYFWNLFPNKIIEEV